LLTKAIERSFINVVNHCGIDINSAAQFPHRSHSLKFVSGLGPRKAQAFIAKIIRTGGKLESRSDLVQNEICARTVFINCASFIRIRAVHFRISYRDSLLDVLDDTRVHPEDYELARKMAADALDLDDAVLEEDDSPSQYVQELMEGDVDRLNLLLLDDYAVELEKRMHTPKRICLNDIKAELMNPFKDSRRKFDGVTLEECFSMLTGESSETLYEGAVVSTIIARVKERFLVVHLGSGVEGIIHIKSIDVNDQADLTRIFKANQALAASVLKINYEKLSVELSARQSDVAASKPRIRFDEYFDFKAQEHDKTGMINKKKAIQKAKRNVQHPFWHSFNYKEAEDYLASRPRGEVVIRPSTKGMDHISITWKVYDGIYKHIDVLEQNKQNDFSLGDILIINSIKYHEIDQIIAEYIDPMSRRISMIIEHLKYQRKTVPEMCK
jgi:transcription elongation factor SPT6